VWQGAIRAWLDAEVITEIINAKVTVRAKPIELTTL